MGNGSKDPAGVGLPWTPSAKAGPGSLGKQPLLHQVVGGGGGSHLLSLYFFFGAILARPPRGLPHNGAKSRFPRDYSITAPRAETLENLKSRQRLAKQIAFLLLCVHGGAPQVQEKPEGIVSLRHAVGCQSAPEYERFIHITAISQWVTAIS